MTSAIHPTAVVSPKAHIGNGVRIGPFCVVDDEVSIGAGTVLEAYVRVANYAEIGEECHIYDHTVVGNRPQDMGFKEQETWVHLGNRVVCREYVTVNRATVQGGYTSIGDDSFIMEGCHIAHDVTIGNRCVMANKVGLSGHVIVGDNAVIGGMTGVHQFVHIGSYAMVGGLSRIVKDVPPYCTVEGNPARIYGLNVVGLRRNGFGSGDRIEIKRIYKELKKSADPIKTTLSRMLSERPDSRYMVEISAFTDSCTRGWSAWSNRRNSVSEDDE